MSNKTTNPPISVKVGKNLVEKGYALASCAGYALTDGELEKADNIGILKPSSTQKDNTLPNIRDAKREFFGVLWLNDEMRGAGNGKWVLEAYGLKNRQEAQEIADFISKRNGVKITVNCFKLGWTETDTLFEKVAHVKIG
jgi:hypothetical protein